MAVDTQMSGGQLSTNGFYTGATSGEPTPQHGQRRRHNFGDRVYKLSPQETPFFAYLNAVGKYPTDDPVFRVLEDRAPTKWADRSFAFDLDSGDAVQMPHESAWQFVVSGGSAADAIPVTAAVKAELLVGMIVQATWWSSERPKQSTGRITAVNAGNTIDVLGIQGDYDESGGAHTAASNADDLNCQVIGSAFAEGTNSPESFGYDISDTQGYTQIFKTSAYMSNTAMATVMRGYASEWDRIWAMKLREHKVDIERAFLYNNKNISGGIQYTDGIIGNILMNGTFTGDATDDTKALSYVEGKPYVRVVDVKSSGTEAVYDRWLKDFEIIFAPERGGADQKFCMASLPVVTYFNQLKGGFMEGSVSATYSYNLDFATVEGGLGHKVMKLDTIHGSLAIVKNPLLKGLGKSMMVGVDLDNVKYRPLVGNGVNRDTYIDTNVQTPDEDSRKDLILTEAGLEVCLPESHFLYQFVDTGVPIG